MQTGMLAGMKQVEVHNWYMPAPAWKGPRAKPYMSSWKMSAEDAARQGALSPVPGTRELREVPETEEEERRRKPGFGVTHPVPPGAGR